MMLFLANIGIVALSPGRWGKRGRDGGEGRKEVVTQHGNTKMEKF